MMLKDRCYKKKKDQVYNYKAKVKLYLIFILNFLYFL